MIRSIGALLTLLAASVLVLELATAFSPAPRRTSPSSLAASKGNDADDVLSAAIDAMYGGGSELKEEPAVTRARIQELVDQNPVLLFMKGSKFFPQCGFSDTATKILETLNVEYETFNVLEDDVIREGIKVYSQWPTIPQLYANGEFVGGSDIMMEMYQDGSLQEMIENVKKE